MEPVGWEQVDPCWLVQQKEKCRTGHLLVLVAPELHVLFRYTPRHDGASVDELLAAFECSPGPSRRKAASSARHAMKKRQFLLAATFLASCGGSREEPPRAPTPIAVASEAPPTAPSPAPARPAEPEDDASAPVAGILGIMRAPNRDCPGVGPTASDGAGQISRETVRAAVRSNMPDLRRCYDELAVRDPGISGRVTLDFRIAPDGHVAHVQSTSGDLLAMDPTFLSCLFDEACTWQFPAPGGAAQIVYPFLFSPTPPP
ncbi:MAG: AgmX/PglI C-terminal domain-containing protein [Deltaproteobacteria bacterium]|nr:AgmX/PglI C-terminal domain-containing protein [Deltaproteobacteria bacterium]